MTRLLSILAAFTALAVPGCGDEGSSDSGSSGSPYGGGAATSAEETATAAAGTTVQLGDSQFGNVLFDGQGQAIYLFEKEGAPKSECYGECAAAWPPVLTKGAPQPGGGLKGALLGEIEREDGSTQVTYNGHPLYYYAHEGPGVVTCHNVDEFGGLWLAVNAQGTPA